MIHVHDQDFEHKCAQFFSRSLHDAHVDITQLSDSGDLGCGSPASRTRRLRFCDAQYRAGDDVARRVRSDPLLEKYFRVLGPNDLIDAQYRPSGIQRYYDAQDGWGRMDRAAEEDQFVLDPTRVTLHVGRTGVDGDTFKKLLMDKYDIQINKTSRNTVLFMIHIGMTRGTIAHLVNVLTQIARDLNDKLDRWSEVETDLFRQQVSALTDDLPPLPNFSRFHPAFLASPDSTTPEGDLRRCRSVLTTIPLASTSNLRAMRC